MALNMSIIQLLRLHTIVGTAGGSSKNNARRTDGFTTSWCHEDSELRCPEGLTDNHIDSGQVQ